MAGVYIVPMSMIKVLVSDHNALVRRGLREILNEQTGMQVLGEATSVVDLFELLRASKWDALLLDVTMPGRPGLDVLKQVKAEFPSLPVVILGKTRETWLVSRCLKAGALVFLSRESPPDEITTAIRRALRNERYVSSEIAQALALQSLDETDEDVTPELLSDRELQVMLMIATGKTTKEIARDLALSEKTVGTYRQRILDKMRMRHNADMIRYVIERKLLSSE